MSRAPALKSRVSPYPWPSLDRVSRDTVVALPALRRALRYAIDERALAASLGQIIDAPVTVVAHAIELVTSEDVSTLHGAAFVLATSDNRLRVGVSMDGALASLLVAKVTRRPARLTDPRMPVNASVSGGVAAIVAATARRAHGTRAVLVPVGLGGLRLAPGERVLRVHATVTVDSEAHAVVVTLPSVPSGATDDENERDTLARLGEVTVTLPVVAAVSTMTSAEVEAMQVNDVWLPGEGWTLRRDDAAWVGDVTLASPSRSRAIRGILRPNGEIMLGEALTLPQDVPMEQLEREDDATIAEAVLDAPLVVRVEVGAVTLTAREWASLSSGDVIPLGKRVAEPVILRVAGLEVARGELVDVEGELGVRIRERRGER